MLTRPSQSPATRLSASLALAFSLGACGASSEAPTDGADPGSDTDVAVADASGDDVAQVTQAATRYGATRPNSIVDVEFDAIRIGRFSRTAQWRAFRFEGRTGQTIDAFADGLSRLDTVLSLYKVSPATGRPLGRALATNDDTDSGGWTLRTNTVPNPLSSSLEAFVLPETRQYALVVTTYRQRYTGRAEVTVRLRFEEPERAQCSGFIAYPECPEGYFCDIDVPDACGGADLPGYCEPVPQGCEKILAPVCGCDGVTYGNDCMRRTARAQLAHVGSCGGEGDLCITDDQCLDGRVCKSGQCRAETWCTVPEDCAGLVHPRCVGAWSCEQSACAYHCGPVPGAEGAACGTRGATPCEEGLVCIRSIEAQCGATDRPGTCQDVRDRFCTQQYDPVCGCDGVTYGNTCMAYASGMSVRSEGECPPEPGNEGASCGPRGLGVCVEGLFCDWTLDGQCGWADAAGTCQTRPTICTREFRPVCGCDGRTYGNRCSAASAGVSVLNEGPCAGR